MADCVVSVTFSDSTLRAEFTLEGVVLADASRVVAKLVDEELAFRVPGTKIVEVKMFWAPSA